jgi:hypothetical protein
MGDRAGRAFRLFLSGGLRSACCVIVLAGAAGPASAQSDAGLARTPTVTRLVQAFGELESRLDAAARAGDAQTLDRLLAADFELRNAARPGVPLPRARFIERMQAQPAAPARTEQMAVHDFGATAVVSFVLRHDPDAASLFVVDVWGKVGDDWRLEVRYAGPGGTAAQSDAPMPDRSDNLPKKY